MLGIGWDSMAFDCCAYVGIRYRIGCHICNRFYYQFFRTYQSLRFGNRLIMLHNGRVIIDVEGEEKANLEIPDLLRMFEKASGDVMANDRMLLG